MLDIKFIRGNRKLVEETIKKRRADVDVAHILEIDDTRLDLIKIGERLRRERKEAAGKKDVGEGRKIKEKLSKQEDALRAVEQEFLEYLEQIPNLLAKEVPDGKGEEDNQEIKKWGEKTKFDFKPREH